MKKLTLTTYHRYHKIFSKGTNQKVSAFRGGGRVSPKSLLGGGDDIDSCVCTLFKTFITVIVAFPFLVEQYAIAK